MKLKYLVSILVIFTVLIFSFPSFASEDSHFFYIKSKQKAIDKTNFKFPYMKGVKVTISPDTPEIIAGEIATFTVSITNKNKYPVNVEYSSGRQYDMVIYCGASQIFRWSNGYTWKKSPHSIPLAPGETRSQKLSWIAVNKNGAPLSQGIYKAVGLATCYPKTLVSEETSFRLIPPSIIAKEVIKTKLNQCFEIELPRFADSDELVWDIVYKYNDNRIRSTTKKIKPETIVLTFLPKRIGHVEFDLYAYPISLNKTFSLERRSYRIEVE